jgi:hypothetical protein
MCFKYDLIYMFTLLHNFLIKDVSETLSCCSELSCWSPEKILSTLVTAKASSHIHLLYLQHSMCVNLDITNINEYCVALLFVYMKETHLKIHFAGFVGHIVATLCPGRHASVHTASNCTVQREVRTACKGYRLFYAFKSPPQLTGTAEYFLGLCIVKFSFAYTSVLHEILQSHYFEIVHKHSELLLLKQWRNFHG